MQRVLLLHKRGECPRPNPCGRTGGHESPPRYAMYRRGGNHSRLNGVYGYEVNPFHLNAVNRVWG